MRIKNLHLHKEDIKKKYNGACKKLHDFLGQEKGTISDNLISLRLDQQKLNSYYVTLFLSSSLVNRV